jgi:hypothetical protein
MFWKFFQLRLGFTMDRVWFVCRALNCFCCCWRNLLQELFVPFIG